MGVHGKVRVFYETFPTNSSADETDFDSTSGFIEFEENEVGPYWQMIYNLSRSQ